MNIKAVVSKVENHIYWKKIEWGFYDKMDDESFLKMAYKRKFGKELDLKNPVTFNEKLQWLKLHDRKPEYTTMVDKYEAKAYIAQKIGKEYVVPTLGVWDKFDDIDFTKLPNAFVLKCTHDSGGLVICKDKSKLDREKARKKINKSLHSNYFGGGREWPYKNVKPRIIAEPLLKDDATKAGEQLWYLLSVIFVIASICIMAEHKIKDKNIFKIMMAIFLMGGGYRSTNGS